MAKPKRSEYIKYSRTLVRKLLSKGYWGAGSLHEEHLIDDTLPDKSKAREVLKALVKQEIICCKKHKYGPKYFLNTDKREKISEIAKEKGTRSIIPLLLMI
jgi:hypothetical protein